MAEFEDFDFDMFVEDFDFDMFVEDLQVLDQYKTLL